MSFRQRFGYYAFGVGLGCLIVYVLLIHGRESELLWWLPEQRVINELAVDSIVISDQLHVDFTDSVLVQKIRSSDVLFKESIVKKQPCREYQLETEAERMRFKLCDSIPELILYQER